MKRKFFKNLILFFVLAPACFFAFSNIGQADQLDVGLTVTNCGNGVVDYGEACDNGSSNGPCSQTCSTSCTINSCGGTSDTTGPSISVVTTTVTNNTFYIKWSATDSSGVGVVSFGYGIGNYNSSPSVVNLGGGFYEVNLSGLQQNTSYQYRITATDSYSTPNTSQQTGTFTTTNIIVDLPATISNVVATPGVTTAVVTFNTNEATIAQVLYGLTNVYGSNTSGGVVATTSHSVILPNLLSSSTYHFKVVVTDSGNNSSESSGYSFATLADIVPPSNVSGFQITTTSNSMILNWVNPVVTDFVGVKILRGINSQITGPNDPAASLSHITSGQTFVDSAVLPNIDYYYSIFSFDTSNNFSSGVYRVGRIVQVTQEVCGNGVDDDSNGKTDCADDVCKNLPSCIAPVEICNNGIDDDRDGLIDCADSDCAGSCVVPSEICNNNIDDDRDGLIDCADSDCSGSCAVDVSEEICGNGADDDRDGFADCADSDCSAFAGCQQVVGAAVCNNGIDDDGDDLVDFPNDPGCSDANDTNEYDALPTTVPDFARLDFNKLVFLAGDRKIVLVPQEKVITGLAGFGLSVALPVSALSSVPESVQLNVGGQFYQAFFASSSQTYFIDLSFPIVGKHDAYLELSYGADQFETVVFGLQSLPKGRVVVGDESISGVEVVLKQKGNVEPYLGVYGEVNPVQTDVNGLFGWMVPNGEYYLEVKKDGFYERVTPVFVVNNNVINNNIKLIKKAETILESVSVAAQLSVQKIEDVANDPMVEKTATEIVTPAVVGVTAVGTVAAVSWFNMVSLLRFVFLQPLMLLGRRKREKWGMVYNSLTKLPVDLAIVRLFNAETGKLLQTKVTDGQGRYAFVMDKGKYRLEAQKINLVFPSELLKGFKNDEEKTDIYHGEAIGVSEKNSLITANIPLDPIAETKPPKRIIRERFLRKLQNSLSLLGLLVTAVSLYISPVWYMWVLLAVHLFILFVFRRIAKPKRAKGWGIVYDQDTDLPVDRVVARLFDSQFNKLVATEITDKSGRYHFLAGGNKYYVTYDRQDYETAKLDVNPLKKKEASAITEDVKIKKKIGDLNN